jgi:type IV pilus assembly protein PilO
MALADTFKTEKLIKLPWYQKALILGGLCVILLALYFLTMDRSYKSQIAVQKDEISKLDKQITDLRTIATDLPKFERQNSLLKKELDKAMTKLPGQPQVDELLKDVTVKAKTNGIEVQSFERKADVQQSLYIEVPVQMKLKANFFPVMIFFNELARMERIVNISDIEIRRPKATQALLDISCTLTAYRFKDAVAEPATGKK